MRVRGNLLGLGATALSIESDPLSEAAGLTDFGAAPLWPTSGPIRDYPPKEWKAHESQPQERREHPGYADTPISLTSVPDSSYRRGTGAKLPGHRHRHSNGHPCVGVT